MFRDLIGKAFGGPAAPASPPPPAPDADWIPVHNVHPLIAPDGKPLSRDDLLAIHGARLASGVASIRAYAEAVGRPRAAIVAAASTLVERGILAPILEESPDLAGADMVVGFRLLPHQETALGWRILRAAERDHGAALRRCGP